MSSKTDFLDSLIECAEDGLKTIHRAASAKGASWAADDRKALTDWSEALSALTTVRAMRDAEERADLGGYAYGMPDYYRHGYPDTWAGRGGMRSTAYGIGNGDYAHGHAPDDVRRRVIADLTRMRDAAPDAHTRAEYARMLYEYGVV